MRSHPLVPVAVLAAVLVAAPAAFAGTISGTAFMDYNSNGAKDAGGFTAGSTNAATDVGVAGVAVAAYDASGAQVASAITAANGTYSMTTPGSGAVRVQFTAPAGYEPSFRGTNDGTSVQFVDGSGTGVDFGVTKASQYCQDNPQLVSCQQQFLDQTARDGVFTMPSRFTWGMRSLANGQIRPGPGDPFRYFDSTRVTAAGDVGSVFGIGVDREGNSYFGTYVKRHSPYGPAGPVNAVYKVDMSSGATSTFATLGVATLPSHNAAQATGTMGLLGTPWPAYSTDGLRADAGSASDVYHLVGRAGLGDVDVTPDGSTLWAVEMTQAAPKLWKVPIEGSGAGTSAGPATAYAIPAPSTYGGVACYGDWHPMGMAVTDERLLVGGVCGAEDRFRRFNVTSIVRGAGGTPTVTATIDPSTPHNLAVGDWVQASSTAWAPGASPDAKTEYFSQVTAVNPAQNTVTYPTWTWVPATPTPVYDNTGSIIKATDAAAFIRELDPTTGTFSTIAAVRLNYPKSGTNGGIREAKVVTTGTAGLWQDWNDSPKAPGTTNSPKAWPMPMLANIELLPDGGLALAFRDRYLDQSTPGAVDYESTSTSSPSTTLVYNAGADMLRLCWNGTSYAKEVNGACPGIAGANVSAILGNRSDIRAESPLYYYSGWWSWDNDEHAYTSIGGVAQMPGSRVLWSTAWDLQNFWQQGVRALGPCPDRADDLGNCGPENVADGAQVGLGAVRFGGSYSQCGAGNSCWQKGNGLADLEIVCDAAPVQIGNRIWIDTNSNGVQDPGEPAVAGVTLHLYDAAGTLVGTAVTDANGTYYFSTTSTAPAAGDGTNVGGGLVAGAEFTIKMDNPADYAAGGPLAPYTVTTANASSPGNAANSKATLAGGYPSITIGARTAGQNNHTFDIGLVSKSDSSSQSSSGGTTPGSTTPTTPLVAVGNYVWVDLNRNGIQDEPPLRGVRVVLLTPDGKRARNAAGKVVPVATTNAAGRYLFDGLAPGSYKVRFTLPPGYRFTVPAKPNAKRNSNPVASKSNPLVGTTPVFRVYGAVQGNTVRNSNPKINASYIDPTIDAGVVRVRGPLGNLPVTG